MKKEIIGAMYIVCICLWLAVSLVFQVLVAMPACVITRPVIRWAFCVQRACELRAKAWHDRLDVLDRETLNAK